MKNRFLVYLSLTVLLCAGSVSAEDEPDMIGTMGQMQLFLHKLSLSVEADNPKLTDFYAHELEENIEAAKRIDEYHDIPVGQLTEAMLVPSFEAFESALESDDPEQIRSRMGELINACNACHQATDYGFIHIQPSESNPYMQSFEPKGD